MKKGHEICPHCDGSGEPRYKIILFGLGSKNCTFCNGSGIQKKEKGENK